MDQIKNGKCCDWSMLQKISGGYCPEGNCSVDKSAQEPAEQPTKPVAEIVKPQDSEFNAAYEAEVVRLVNEERAKYGLAALIQDDGAQNVAHVRAKEIVQSFSHTRPDGSSCFTAASDLGVTYRSAGENIAYGYATPAQVVNGWMNSEGHRKNILSASYTKIGVGSYSANGVMYWSQFFIGRKRSNVLVTVFYRLINRNNRRQITAWLSACVFFTFRFSAVYRLPLRA